MAEAARDLSTATPMFDELWRQYVTPATSGEESVGSGGAAHLQGADGDLQPAGVEHTQVIRRAASAAAVLAAYGILRAGEVVELAGAAGLDLAAAAVLLEKESGGGRNVWGHDAVDTGGTYVKGAEVTREAYLAYKVRRAQLGCQGVGPCQLTWAGYQDQADAIGGCWDWRNNVTVGFRILAGGIKANGPREGFRRYNGSGPAAERYADDAMCRYRTWTTRLAGCVRQEDDLTPDESRKLDDLHGLFFTARKPWGGGISDISVDTPEDMQAAEAYFPDQYWMRDNVEVNQVHRLLRQLVEDVNELKAKFGG